MAKRQSIQSIRARFTETTTSSLLEKPLVSHGTIVAAPPSRVLMVYTDPERRVVAIDSKSLVVAWPDRRQRETIDISQTQKRIDQYFTQATIDQLRSMFEIQAEPDRSLAGSDRIEMVPKRKQIKNGLERLSGSIATAYCSSRCSSSSQAETGRQSGWTMSLSTCQLRTRRFRSGLSR